MIEILSALYNAVDLLPIKVISIVAQTCKDANIFRAQLSKLFVEYAKYVCTRNYVINVDQPHSKFTMLYDQTFELTTQYNCIYEYCKTYNTLFSYSTRNIIKFGWIFYNKKTNTFTFYERTISMTDDSKFSTIKQNGIIHTHVGKEYRNCKICKDLSNHLRTDHIDCVDHQH